MSISVINNLSSISNQPLSQVSGFRSVTIDDWVNLRDLRLKALKDAPKAFGIALEDVASTCDDEWKKLCHEASEGNGKWYVVAEHEGKLIGMLGATEIFGKHMRHQVEICHAWVEESFRGQGIMTKLYMVLKDRLQEVAHLEQMIAWVTLHETQTSRYLFEKVGFKIAGTLSKTVKFADQYYDCCWLEAPLRP